MMRLLQWFLFWNALLLGVIVVVEGRRTEREILNQLFADTAGPQWLSRNGWATADPICSWYGVTCDDNTADQGVISLELPSNNVARKLTPHLYQLPSLRFLDLSDNPIQDASLEGLGLVDEGDTSDLGTPSPLTMVDLSQCLLTHASGIRLAAETLVELRLTKNQLAFFPSDIYQLTNLQKLYVNYNPMRGIISGQIGQLRALQEFYAYSNQLTGSLPTEIGLLDKVRVFTMANNRLTGTIPTEVNNMLNLQVFSLHGGTADDEEGGIGSMESSHADHVGLTGSIPSFAAAPRLSKLFLADNSFTGSLPDDFLAHNQLTEDYVLVNLRNNKLTGGIPPVLRRFSTLNLDLVGNTLTGNIPDYLCTRSQWMNGLVASYGCDAILCHAGSYNDRGQQTSDEAPCLPCPGASSGPPGSSGPPVQSGSESPYLLGATACPNSNPGPGGPVEVGGGTATDSGGLPTVDPARVLMNLYLQTDGSRWEQKSGWEIFDSFTSSSVDLNQIPLDHVDQAVYCHFHGLICDSRGNLVNMMLSNNRLRGTIPPDVFRLPGLRSIDLSFNRIDLDFSKPVSAGGGLAILEHAPELQHLKLSQTSITRVDGISRGADSLTRLFLDGTDLEQAIPSDIYALTNLNNLHLSAAYLTGKMSTEIGLLTDLKTLDLNGNQISGAIPTELGLLTSLEHLDLSDNDFEGFLPTYLEKLTSLLTLRINGARGGLGGKILPFEQMPSLTELQLAYNLLTGSLPDNFLAGTDREIPIKVRLTGNNLVGKLPESLATFPEMIIEVEDNKISEIPAILCEQSLWMEGEVGRTSPNACDAILCPPFTWSPHGKASPTLGLACEDCPGNAFFGETVCETGDAHKSRETEILDELFQATGGRYWNLTHTNWTKPGIPICQREGVICTGTTDLNTGVTELILSRFGLRGTVPSSVYELTKLRRLALSWNPVELNFTGVGDAQGLEVIQLSGTKITSVAGLESASPVLHEVHLAKTGLEGTFPTELLQARTIRRLFMSGNRLTGTIPSDISQLALEQLHLDGNELTGAIPKEIGMLTNMEELYLQNNKLMGLIPSQLGMMPKLHTLDVSQQRGELKLTGPLYPFDNNPALTTLNFAGNYLAGLLPANLLEKVDEDASITVDLSGNLLAGSVPAEYDRFRLLTIDLTNNMIDTIPSVLCDNLEWMDGAPAGTTSCDFILCPPHTTARTGRATAGESCQVCPYSGQAPFFGSTACDIAPVEGERDVLVQFYRATNGDDWVYNENWNTVLNVCTWYGIMCNEDFSVTEIRLENNGLENENEDTDVIGLLSRLTNLRAIDLKGNQLVLTLNGIPHGSSLASLRLSSTVLESVEGIGKAKNLTSFHAVDCGLSGNIPEEIYGLDRLVELYLSFNSLNGTLSPSIQKLARLEQLILYGNNLSGTIPKELTELSKLRELVLGKNMLWGPIPEEIDSMEELEQVSLQDQQGRELIDGKMPSFSSAKNLWYIDFSSNDLTGSIPDALLQGMNSFNASIMILLRDNELTGSLPTSLLKFDDLFVDLGGNRIDSIPSSFCAKKDWMYGAVGDVGTCAAILCPKGFYSDSGRQDTSDEPCKACSGGGAQYLGQTMCQVFESDRDILTNFFLETGGNDWVRNSAWGSNTPICSWSGVRCTGDQQDDDGVERIDLSFNGLVGTVPSDFWSLPQLKQVDLRGNDGLFLQFSGFPSDSLVETLDLSNTRVLSLDGLGNARHLRELKLDEAGLCGTFPSEVLDLHETLEKLHLSWNMLVGTIPAAIDRLSKLADFQITGNDFHGTLPSGIGFLENLEKIRMDETLISGALPATELSYLPRLQSFSASRSVKSGRKLTGEIPPFDKVPALESLFLDGQDLSGSLPHNFLSASIYVREVVLTDNEITGSLPLELDTHENVNLELANNKISSLPVTFCDNDGWMQGNVGKLSNLNGSWIQGHNGGSNNSCDAIMCAPGTFNRYGRAVNADEMCQPCDGQNVELAPYYGSITCEAPADQRSILIDMFNSCQGKQWYRNDYWGSAADVCDWYGVGCNNGDVVLINLDANNLRGHIPASVFRLPKLQVLWLNSNRVSVDFANIYEATNLLDLRLDSTGLRSLEGIGQAQSLTVLSLAFNGIRGRFPSEIFQLNNLRYLAMNSNVMTGLLPNLFGNMRYLRTLKLDRNIFVGPLPPFEQSPAMTQLYLGANELSGTIPHSLLGGLSSQAPAIHVDVSRNRLEGSVPESLGRFENLVLDVTQNQITEIPSTLCSKSNWNNGDVDKYGCDAILCPARTSNSAGRRQDNLPCRPCHHIDSDHLGQTVCGGATSGASETINLLFLAGLSLTAVAFVL